MDLRSATVDVRPVLAAYALEAPLTLFGLPQQGANNTMYGVRSAAGSFVLKRFDAADDGARLDYEHRLLGWLGARTLPFAVPVPRAARDGRTLVDYDQQRYALYPWLPGRQSDEHNLTQLRAFGAALGELHQVLVAYPCDRVPGLWRYDQLEHLHALVPDPYGLTPAAIGLAPGPAVDALCAWWRGELTRLRPFIEQRYPALPRQVIHGDYDPSNTLYDGARLTAILDFEFASPDARAMDLAAGLHWTLRPVQATLDWPAAAAVLGGYTSVVALGGAEAEALPELMRLRNVATGIWWLGRHQRTGMAAQRVERLAWTRSWNTVIEQHRATLVALAAHAP